VDRTAEETRSIYEAGEHVSSHTPVQTVLVAVPAVVWTVVALRTPKTGRGVAVATLGAFAITVCAAFALFEISN
jgi:hypothetical protein